LSTFGAYEKADSFFTAGISWQEPPAMKVLHVIPSLDSRDGGPTTALSHMASCAAAEGISVFVATTIDRQEAVERELQFGVPTSIDSWTCYFFPRQTRFYKVSLSLLKWLWEHSAEYDLIHIHAVFSFAPIAAWRAAWRSGTPYIVSPHGLLNQWGMVHRRKHIKAISFRFIERPLLDRASAIHYTSTAEQDEAASLHLTARSVVVPLGIDTAVFSNLPDHQVFEKQHPDTKGRARVLFLSRIDPKKGIEVLLQAWKLLAESHPNALLVLAGSGAADYTASLHALAKHLRVESRIIWTGLLGPEERCAALGAADVFVLPSKSESFGLALLEAMAAGVPCVSTSGVALGQEAAATGAVRLASYDASALASAITDLLDSPETRAHLSAMGKSFAVSRYSLKSMGEGLAALYREIAK
jgi:glycosyltransferase involved in cell wall biosynthesis